MTCSLLLSARRHVEVLLLARSVSCLPLAVVVLPKNSPPQAQTNQHVLYALALFPLPALSRSSVPFTNVMPALLAREAAAAVTDLDSVHCKMPLPPCTMRTWVLSTFRHAKGSLAGQTAFQCTAPSLASSHFPSVGHFVSRSLGDFLLKYLSS